LSASLSFCHSVDKMGISNYFKASASQAPPAGPSADRQQKTQSPPASEKPSSPAGNDMELQPPSKFSSRPQSISARSTRSNMSSMMLDEIKHEVMVNYLYQQQCSHLWVSDGSGEVEGVLLRKSRGHYMACPPELGNSALAVACAALNVQVSLPLRLVVYRVLKV
jgi:hypothetical protein